MEADRGVPGRRGHRLPVPRRVDAGQKARAERIAAFQAEQGDGLLISLKAGGMGPNLTAADYVIHMDPWWNPAAEDQVSEHVHRIGQVRPEDYRRET